MGSGGFGRYELCACVDDAGEFDGAAGLRVDSAGPGDSTDKRRCGEELAGPAVEHIEEAVLVCLQDDFPGTAVQFQIGLDQRLRRVVIEAIAGSRLVVPREFAGTGVDGDDGGTVEIVALTAKRSYQGFALPVPNIKDRALDRTPSLPRRQARACLPPFPYQRGLAAASIALDSNRFDGSPGTV